MEPRDLIMDISSRLVVNKAAMKMKNAAIVELLGQFERTLAKRD
jgi:ATP phosphoribosyltransferase